MRDASIKVYYIASLLYCRWELVSLVSEHFDRLSFLQAEVVSNLELDTPLSALAGYELVWRIQPFVDDHLLDLYSSLGLINGLDVNESKQDLGASAADMCFKDASGFSCWERGGCGCMRCLFVEIQDVMSGHSERYHSNLFGFPLSVTNIQEFRK